MSNPTAQEQEFLELTNRMRVAPRAELDLLLNSADPATKAAIDGALKQFGTNLVTLKSQWDNLNPVAALAWSSELNQSAATHNQMMIAANIQDHTVPGEKQLKDRLTDVNYDFRIAAENIYAATINTVYGQAGLAIDWGEDDPNTTALEAIDGIQNPAKHRQIILDGELREVGISITTSNDPTKQNVGPFVITEDFGDRFALKGKAYILGVAFDDKNQDSWYEAGEGVSDVQVRITGIKGTNYTQILNVGAAGGYQQLVDPGEYQVEFIRNGMVVQTRTTSISSQDIQNVKLDLITSDFVPDFVFQNNSPTPVTTTVDMVKRTVTAETNNLQNLVLTTIPLGSNLQNGTPGVNLFDFTKDFTQSLPPDLKSQTITVNFTGVTAEASYHNYAGLYRVDDAAGRIDNLKPGDAGYMTAALKRSKEAGQDVEFDRNGISTKNLKGGYIYAPFVVADGTVDQVLNSKDPKTAPHVYFNYVAANQDGFNHIKSLGANKFGFEDIWGGGDKDYNDLVFQVNAKIA